MLVHKTAFSNLHQSASSLNGANGEATNSDDVNTNDERKRMFKEAETHKHSKIADGKHRKPKNDKPSYNELLVRVNQQNYQLAQAKKLACEIFQPTQAAPASVKDSPKVETAKPDKAPTTPGNGDSAGSTLNPLHAGTVPPTSDAKLDSAAAKQENNLPRPPGVSAPPSAPLITRKLYYTLPKQCSVIPFIVMIMLTGAIITTVLTPGVLVIPVYLVLAFLVFSLYKLVPVYRTLYDLYRFLCSSIPEVEAFGHIDTTMYNTANDKFSPATGKLRYHYGREFNAYRVVDISKEMYDFLCLKHPNAQPRIHTIQMFMSTLTNEFSERDDIPRDIAQNTADVYFQDMIRLEEQRMLLGARRTIQIV
jgi:hypothetical protein